MIDRFGYPRLPFSR